ncbi:leucine-rich repeat-containing protein 23 [Lepisosteus oculatus]|uniref:Leucine-rich repeat-containing protein 23 n=1 Tax=Lepisosteus oculatus TaxID=7918 RepID=W5NAD2_LEPOC|nr:PREDICTED: leucine-rich repeat-containing protein 23 [Lepisosteus oculatus]XP_015205620.1 PREDICTED: leucine-rich repeat-containing protein 23 [Lepisosteus oculatus]
MSDREEEGVEDKVEVAEPGNTASILDSEGEEGGREEGEGQGEEEALLEKEEKLESCPLTSEMISEGLSLLCRTGNGLAHAFVRLELKERGLTDLNILSSFVHLRFLDISSNYLSDLSPLASLSHLLWLKADGNLLDGFKGQPLGQLEYLQWLNLASNRIKNTEGLGGPSLETLNLTGNGIQSISGLDYGRLANLVTLELRGNRLETTDGIYLPNLRRLYLAQNLIKRLEGLERLEKLTTLHLRDNRIESLEGFSEGMKSLQYLNMRGNLVFSPRALLSLAPVAGSLRALVLSENPLSESEDYRMSVLLRLPLLERLDKDAVTAEERSEVAERQREFGDEEVTEQEEY